MDSQPTTIKPCCKNDRWFKPAIIIIGILIILGLFGNIYLLAIKQTTSLNLFSIKRDKTVEKPSYCNDPDVGAIYQCKNSLIKIFPKEQVPGTGFYLIDKNGNRINCPVVSLDNLPEECRITDCSPSNVCD